MNIVIDRKWKKDTYTIGKMYIDGKVFSDTLEDRDRGLDSTMTPGEIAMKKVYGETAIPKGTYEVRMTHSGRFSSRPWGKRYGGKVPEITNVKGYSGVRIHPLNTAKDSLGCIGVGKNNVKGRISESTAYYYRLLDNHIVPAINRGEKVTLTIK